MKNEITLRQEKARNLMSSNGFAVLVLATAENIQYFAGVLEPSIQACGVVILPPQAQSVLAVLWLDKEAALEQAKESRVETYTPETQGRVVTKTLERLGVVKGAIGIDDRALKVLGNSLRQSLPNTKLVNISNTVGLRSVKSEEEIRLIQKACEISEQGMKIALGSVKPGMTELQVAALAEYEMIKLGSDGVKHKTMVASGSRTRLIHPFATQKKIANGDLVAIDLGAVYGGYCADIARSFVVGRPDEELKNAFGALCAAQDAVLQKLRPGVSIREVETVAQEATKAAGHQLIGFVGHSIGLQVEEYPFLRIAGAPDPGLKLERNMVVAFFQSSIQRRRNSGVRLEDTVVITETGAKMLTTYPRELFC